MSSPRLLVLLLAACAVAAATDVTDKFKRAACHTDKLLPYQGHCDKFIQCSNGKEYIMPCPDGLVFSYKEQVCDWPKYVPGCA